MACDYSGGGQNLINLDIDRVLFSLIGHVGDPAFQRCLHIIEFLTSRLKNEYQPPYIRPMFHFDWEEYLIKARRQFGKKLWTLEKGAAVFLGDEYLGDDEDLLRYVGRRFRVRMDQDFETKAQCALLELYKKHVDLGRTFVYFTFVKNQYMIGTIIFMLYKDLAPKTCRRFLKRLNCYWNAPVHRIAKTSWIQIGGFGSKEKKFHACENFKVPHNRRGILSMCNDGRLGGDGKQFFVSLEGAPWMDCRYVAFGQMIQGDYVLREIERSRTYYESPKDKIYVSQCGEMVFDDVVDAEKLADLLNYYRTAQLMESNLPRDIHDPRDVPSRLFAGKYLRGLYWFDLDDRKHSFRLHSKTALYLKKIEQGSIGEEEEGNVPKYYDDRVKMIKKLYGITSELFKSMLKTAPPPEPKPIEEDEQEDDVVYVKKMMNFMDDAEYTDTEDDEYFE